jgi:hypothetical protein
MVRGLPPGGARKHFRNGVSNFVDLPAKDLPDGMPKPAEYVQESPQREHNVQISGMSSIETILSLRDSVKQR